MKTRKLAAASLLGMVGLAGCIASNEAGNLAATTFGDTTHPVTRGSPIQELRDACGAAGMTVTGAVVHRQPYLQQVTTTSAMIGWVSVTPDGQRVTITNVDGSLVSEAMATIEEHAQRNAGEHQMWTRVEGLQPDTIYCYALGSTQGPLTERIGFRTAPSATSLEPVRFMAFGDSGGGGSDQQQLFRHMYDVPYDLIIHTGDIAYDSGTIGEFEDNVFSVYADLFKSLPFFPAAGNHEYETMQGAPFRDVFSLPSAGEQWYSYDWGRVHFVALDTEADYATQAEWLDRDLESSTLPWTIVYLHRPPYSSGEHLSDLVLRDALAPILEKHGVQLVLSGHDHDYERMVPQAGVAYVVTGGGGRGTRPVGNSDFTAFSEEVIHFVQVEVGADELVLHAIDGIGVEFDSMVVPVGAAI